MHEHYKNKLNTNKQNACFGPSQGSFKWNRWKGLKWSFQTWSSLIRIEVTPQTWSSLIKHSTWSSLIKHSTFDQTANIWSTLKKRTQMFVNIRQALTFVHLRFCDHDWVWVRENTQGPQTPAPLNLPISIPKCCPPPTLPPPNPTPNPQTPYRPKGGVIGIYVIYGHKYIYIHILNTYIHVSSVVF